MFLRKSRRLCDFLQLPFPTAISFLPFQPIRAENASSPLLTSLRKTTGPRLRDLASSVLATYRLYFWWCLWPSFFLARHSVGGPPFFASNEQKLLRKFSSLPLSADAKTAALVSSLTWLGNPCKGPTASLVSCSCYFEKRSVFERSVFKMLHFSLDFVSPKTENLLTWMLRRR